MILNYLNKLCLCNETNPTGRWTVIFSSQRPKYCEIWLSHRAVFEDFGLLA